MTKKQTKIKKEKQQSLGISGGGLFPGLVYRFRKMESLIAISPFWRSPFVWFVTSFSIFLYIVLYFFLADKIGDLPPMVPFLFYYPEGSAQLVNPIMIWYFYFGMLGWSALNMVLVGFFYQPHRYEARFLLGAEFVKTLLFAILIYKTFFNWIL